MATLTAMVPSTASSTRRRRYDAIAGLRAVAAATILIHHFLLVHTSVAGTLRYAHHLEVGVPIFFVISGFVLWLPWVDVAPAAINVRAVTRYARRRVARIVPAFWMALSLAVVARLSTGPIGDQPWTYYGFLQVYSMHTYFNGLSPAWSLGPEVTFYIVLPLLAVAAIRLGSKKSIAVGIGIFIGAFVFRYISISDGAPALSFTLAATIDWFVLGMVLASVTVRTPGLVAKLNPSVALATAVALVVLMGLLRLPWGVLSNNDHPTAAGWLTAHLIYGVIGLLACAAAVSAEDRTAGLVPRMLRNRGVLWLGTVSYGIYLWHVPAIFAVSKLVAHGWLPQAAPVQFGFVAVGTVAVASASWMLLERPILRSRFVR